MRSSQNLTRISCHRFRKLHGAMLLSKRMEHPLFTPQKTGQWWWQSSSIVSVLAGHVSQAYISWLSDDPRLPIGIWCQSLYTYKLIQYYQQLMRLSGANYPPPSPAPPLVSQDLAFWLPLNQTKILELCCVLKLINHICNRLMLPSLLLSLLGCMMRKVLAQNRTISPILIVC